jgi:hypothetical protein
MPEQEQLVVQPKSGSPRDRPVEQRWEYLQPDVWEQMKRQVDDAGGIRSTSTVSSCSL